MEMFLKISSCFSFRYLDIEGINVKLNIGTGKILPYNQIIIADK